MKKDGKYRYSLQFGMDTEEELQAGEFLERLGNRKSAVIVSALCEFMEAHPECQIPGKKIQVRLTAVGNDRLEELVRRIIEEKLAGMDLPAQGQMPLDSSGSSLNEDLFGMLDDLELFQNM